MEGVDLPEVITEEEQNPGLPEHNEEPVKYLSDDEIYENRRQEETVGLPEVSSSAEDMFPDVTSPDAVDYPDVTSPDAVALPEVASPDEAALPEVFTSPDALPEVFASPDAAALPEVASPDAAALPEVTSPDAVALPEVTSSDDAVAVDAWPEVGEPAESLPVHTDLLGNDQIEALPIDNEEEKQPEELPEDANEEKQSESMHQDEEEPVEAPSAKRKLEGEEKSRKKQKVEPMAGANLQLSLSLDEVQGLMDLKEAAVNANRSFYTIDALLYACKKAMETQPDFNDTTGLRIDLQLLPTHLTHQQLVQFRAQLLCQRLLIRNMQPPDRVLHTARGGFNKKELEYAEFRRNLLPNIPETILEMNEYDKQSRIELANRRAKFWTDLQASGY